MKTVGTGSGLSKLISEISTAASASTSDISKVTAALKQLNVDATAAGKALQSIKAGANLSSVPTVVGKIGTSIDAVACSVRRICNRYREKPK